MSAVSGSSSSGSSEYVQENQTNCTVPNIGAEILSSAISMLAQACEKANGE